MGQVVDGGLHPLGHEPAAEAEQKVLRATGPDLTLAQALRTRTYWITMCCMAAWSMSGTGVQFHIVPIFAERGLAGAEVAAMFSIYALTIACGRLGGGILADKFPLNGLIAAAMTCQGIGLVLLNTLAPHWLPQLFPVAFAVGSGLLMSVGGTIWVRYYGRRHLGKIRGSATTIGVAASGVGPFVMGVAYDFFGSFSQVLWPCWACGRRHPSEKIP
jgi:cyanate permease